MPLIAVRESRRNMRYYLIDIKTSVAKVYAICKRSGRYIKIIVKPVCTQKTFIPSSYFDCCRE